jgi:hypothetical protein
MSKRGRPKKLTNSVKGAIVRLYEEHPDWTVQDIRDALKSVLFDELKTQHPEWIDKQVSGEVTEYLPGSSTIQKFWKPIKERDKPSLLEQPWTLGTLKDYPLPPEGIAKVFAIKCMYGQPPKRPKGAWGITLSIREALWISRLSSLPMALDRLQETALAYADAERVSELSGIPFDTYDRDEEIYEVLAHPGQLGYVGEWRPKHEGTRPQEG